MNITMTSEMPDFLFTVMQMTLGWSEALSATMKMTPMTPVIRFLVKVMSMFLSELV